MAERGELLLFPVRRAVPSSHAPPLPQAKLPSAPRASSARKQRRRVQSPLISSPWARSDPPALLQRKRVVCRRGPLSSTDTTGTKRQASPSKLRPLTAGALPEQRRQQQRQQQQQQQPQESQQGAKPTVSQKPAAAADGEASTLARSSYELQARLGLGNVSYGSYTSQFRALHQAMTLHWSTLGTPGNQASRQTRWEVLQEGWRSAVRSFAAGDALEAAAAAREAVLSAECAVEQALLMRAQQELVLPSAAEAASASGGGGGDDVGDERSSLESRRAAAAAALRAACVAARAAEAAGAEAEAALHAASIASRDAEERQIQQNLADEIAHFGLKDEKGGGEEGGVKEEEKEGALPPAVAESPEHMAMRRAFEHYDVDGDGIIDEGEFRDLLLDMQVDATKQTIADALAAVDVNGNGLIEFAEFSAWWLSDEPKNDERTGVDNDAETAMMRRAFAHYAQGGSVLSRERFRELVYDMRGDVTEEEIADALVLADASGQGAITLDDLAQYWLQ